MATSFAYDYANRLTTLTHQITGGSALATYVYGYDNGNRVTSEQNAEGTVTYGYDVTNELTGASGSRAETYTYDSGGNRTMTGYSTGTGNELTASPGTTYTYDNEGNMTAQANTSTHVVTSYTYDYHNHLTGVTVGGSALATYVYDALGRRIGFKDNGAQTWVVWDGQNPYADFDGSGGLKERYLYGPAIDALLARTDSGGTTAWYLTGRLGTVRDIASTAGTVLDHLSYDSFGTVLSESNSGNGDRFKFTGREFDATVGLYDYRARDYAPTAGRFTTQDPIGFQGDDTTIYRYVDNASTDYLDGYGLQKGTTPPANTLPGKIKPVRDPNSSVTVTDVMRIQDVIARLHSDATFRRLESAIATAQGFNEIMFTYSGKDKSSSFPLLGETTPAGDVTIFTHHPEYTHLSDAQNKRLLADCIAHEFLHKYFRILDHNPGLVNIFSGLGDSPSLTNKKQVGFTDLKEFFDTNYATENAKLKDIRVKYVNHSVDLNKASEDWVQEILNRTEGSQNK